MKFFLVLFVSILIAGSSANLLPPFEYRAAFQVAGPVDGDITSRKADIENSIENILMEIVNNGSTGFNYTLGSITLEKLTNGSTSELVVNINFNSVTKSISDFAAILRSFSIAEMINGSSVTAGDYDECVNNFDQCSNKAGCTNTKGAYTCACIDSYHDSSTNGVPGTTCEVPFSVECYSDRTKVTAIKAYFDSKNIYVSDLKFGSCNGSDNGTYLIYEGLCDATITPNSTHTILQWNFTNTASTSDLNIGFSFRYPITCILDSELTGNVTFNTTQEEIVADPPADSIDGGDQVANAAFTLKVTKGANGLGSVVSGPVETSQDLSFELTSPGLLQNSILVIESVTSSPAENPNQKVNIISSGCLETRTTANAAIIDNTVSTGNGMSSTALFKTQSHYYRGSSATTMSFSLRICISTGGVSCQPGCSKRKRSVLTWKAKREATTADRGVIEYSFSRDPNEQLCQKDCGEVSGCILDSLRNELCVCPVGYDIVNGKCAAIPGYNFGSESTDSTATVDADKTMMYILIGLACVLVLLIAVLAVIVFKKQVTTVKINP